MTLAGDPKLGFLVRLLILRSSRFITGETSRTTALAGSNHEDEFLEE